jgi:transcriptional regulator with XRE-family HTH domain
MIGEALRLIRVFHDLKQNELARELGISQSFLSEIERGQRKPSNELIGQYALHFDIPVSSIWFFQERMHDGLQPDVFEKAKGLVAEKVLTFLRLIETRAGPLGRKVDETV